MRSWSTRSGRSPDAASAARPEQGEPREALERVLRATWQKLDRFQALLTINTARLSPEELHRRHLPVLEHFVPLIERGQKAGDFRCDLPVTWHLAVIRASCPHGELRAAGRPNPGGRRRGRRCSRPCSPRSASRSTRADRGYRSARGSRSSGRRPFHRPMRYSLVAVGRRLGRIRCRRGGCRHSARTDRRHGLDEAT